MTKLIQGGTVVTATETMQADVLIEDEQVVALRAPGHHRWVDSAGEIVNASGMSMGDGRYLRRGANQYLR